MSRPKGSKDKKPRVRRSGPYKKTSYISNLKPDLKEKIPPEDLRILNWIAGDHLRAVGDMG